MLPRHHRLPAAPAPRPSPTAFVQVPLASLPPVSDDQAAWQRALYEWALNQAAAVVQPSLPERDLAGVWN